MTPKTLLIVEDDVLDQELIGRKLVNLHAQLSMVDNLDAAYKFIRTELPEVIILDIGVPFRQGGPVASIDQVLEFVRYHADRVGVVMLTGDSSKTDIDQFYAAGAIDYIGKEKIIEGGEFVFRVQLAHKLRQDMLDKKEGAALALQIAILRSNQDKMIGKYPLTTRSFCHSVFA